VLKIIHRFGKHFSCHLQGEYVMVGHFRQPDIGGELDMMVPIGGAEERAAIQWKMSTCLKNQ
jgi:hypothetical protein